MTKLSSAELDSWNDKGFIGPFTALPPPEMAAVLDEIGKTVMADLAQPAGPPPTETSPQEARRARVLRATRNRHLDVRAIARVCSHPELVERLASLLGPDLVLWRSQVFLQTGAPGRGLPWHSDHYAALLAEPGTNLSAHIALNPA